MPERTKVCSLHLDDGIATLILGRRPVNAFDDDFIRELMRALDRVDERRDLAVLHIRSGLPVFSAGADLQLMRDCLTTPHGRDRMIDVVRALQRLFDRIESLSVVSLAEIAGAAVGGGLELALACDLRMASGKAGLGLPEAGLGLLPAAGGTQRLPRICGEAVARRLILGAETIDGNEAYRLGLVHWVTAADELESTAARLAKRLGSLPAEALASCKRCIAAASDPSVDGFQLELTETRRLHDLAGTQQRIQSFLDKSG